jgi:peptidoglycan/xylan/chitin deacetylase (PgdA/CDA1 family)
MLKYKLVIFLTILSFAIPSFAVGAEAPVHGYGGMVSISFDDGTDTTYTLAAPIMAKYGYTGTAYVYTKAQIEEYDTGFMMWPEVISLQNDFGWEIGSHGYSHDNLTTLSSKVAKKEILNSKRDLERQGINVRSFATPYGAHNANLTNYIAKLYDSHRTAWNLANTYPVNDYYLKARPVLPNTDPAVIKGWIDEAKANNQWLILYFHSLTEGTPLPENDDYSTDDFRTILDHISSSALPVVQVSEGVDLWATGENQVTNGSFEQGTGSDADNWVRSSTKGVKVIAFNQGSYPSPKKSAKVVGHASKQRSISSMGITVDESINYRLKAFYRVTNYSAGDASVWISEFDENYNYIGGQWLGGFAGNYLGTRTFSYTPNTGTKNIEIYFITHAGAKMKLEIDNVELSQI